VSKPINEMSEEEIQAEIMRLQAIKPPSAAPRKPKRMDAARKEKDPAKRTWRDELFS